MPEAYIPGSIEQTSDFNPQGNWVYEERAQVAAGAYMDRTARAEARVAVVPHGGYELRNGVPHYMGREMIRSGSRIDGNVYVGAGPREAIVVDGEKYPNELNRAYGRVKWAMRRAVLEKVMKGNGTNLSPLEVSQIVARITADELGAGKSSRQLEDDVSGVIQRSTDRAKKAAEKEGRVYNPDIDVKIDINSFMRSKAGVCRHRAVLAGYLFERLIKENKIGGNISVERGTLPTNNGVNAGHSWVRYESGGVTLIVDPALGYVGDIRSAPRGRWNYQIFESMRENK